MSRGQNLAASNAGRYHILEHTLVSVVERVKTQVAKKMQRQSTRGGSGDPIRDAKMSEGKVLRERWGDPLRQQWIPPEDGGERGGVKI